MPQPTLLISLGTAPAIVPEAFYFPGIPFGSVHVLTTANTQVALIQQFFKTEAPDVQVQITRVEGFNDLNSSDDHFRFEEVLYRWILAAEPDRNRRYVCLSGGYKTISASMLRAAEILGAAEVFHVLADSFCSCPKTGTLKLPGTIDEIRAAQVENHLHFIRLGRESGWPQFRSVTATDYPLDSTLNPQDGAFRATARGSGFRQHLNDVVTRTHRITESWDRIPSLPFTELATASNEQLLWLSAEVTPETDREWIARLPKIELHCHLGGFATEGPDLDFVRGCARRPDKLPALLELEHAPNWPLPTQPIGLEPYRHLGDNNGSRLLRDPGCLVQQCDGLYAHLLSQNVVYAEIRCSPANYAGDGRSAWNVLAEIQQAFQKCMEEARHAAGTRVTPCHVNLLLIGTRQSSGDYRAGISRHLALAVTASEHWQDPDACRVVGVDLAGYEDVSTRAHYFREEFTAIHRCGLALTVHAGENDDAEGIWRAVFDLNALRIGHALSLAQSPELTRSMANRRVAVEMCPYANFQIRGFWIAGSPARPDPAGSPARSQYPLLKYLRDGIRATVNTDNIGISGASLTDNLLLAARLCPGLTRLDLLQLQRNALEAAFMTPDLRTALLARFDAAALLP